jgi:hypothetical protein
MGTDTGFYWVKWPQHGMDPPQAQRIGDRQNQETDEKSPSRKVGAPQDMAEILRECLGIEGALRYAEIGGK